MEIRNTLAPASVRLSMHHAGQPVRPQRGERRPQINSRFLNQSSRMSFGASSNDSVCYHHVIFAVTFTRATRIVQRLLLPCRDCSYRWSVWRGHECWRLRSGGVNHGAKTHAGRPRICTARPGDDGLLGPDAEHGGREGKGVVNPVQWCCVYRFVGVFFACLVRVSCVHVVVREWVWINGCGCGQVGVSMWVGMGV